MNKDEWSNDFDWIDPILGKDIYDAVKGGCELRVKGTQDMDGNRTKWEVESEGSFFMHIAGIAELIRGLAITQARAFARRGVSANKDGSPTPWEDIAEMLIVSVAHYLGFNVTVTGRFDPEENIQKEMDEMSKYKEI